MNIVIYEFWENVIQRQRKNYILLNDNSIQVNNTTQYVSLLQYKYTLEKIMWRLISVNQFTNFIYELPHFGGFINDNGNYIRYLYLNVKVCFNYLV